MSDPNPIQHFHQWFCLVRDQFPEVEVNAMALSTIGLDGFPIMRMVLLKQYTWEGFIFYSQYTSNKGKAIQAHPKVHLAFPWEKAGKRISIEGIATKLDAASAEAYFDTRPRESKIGAWASTQSESIASRQVLEQSYQHFDQVFEGKTVEKPDRWGGYLVRPVKIVFEEQLAEEIKYAEYVLYDELDWEVQEFFLPN